MIKHGRRRMQRKGPVAKLDQVDHDPVVQVGTKRLKHSSTPDSILGFPAKRMALKTEPLPPKKDYSLAKQLISSFNSLGDDLQEKVLEAVDRELRLDPHLLNQAIKQQVAMLSVKAQTLYEQK